MVSTSPLKIILAVFAKKQNRSQPKTRFSLETELQPIVDGRHNTSPYDVQCEIVVSDVSHCEGSGQKSDVIEHNSSSLFKFHQTLRSDKNTTECVS